jgi:hypothetical protein
MVKNDFCNPHQLLRTKAKLAKRKAFFLQFFSGSPVYLLNTIEKPGQSLQRLKKLDNIFCLITILIDDRSINVGWKERG